MFFPNLYKRTEQSLRSFTFFIKEQNFLFGLISHTKIANLAKKERKERSVLFIRLKKNVPFFFQSLFIYIYLYIYLYIYFYISIYILKKEQNILRSFAKEQNILAFFTFFAKEPCILCVRLRSLQKNIASLRLCILFRSLQKNVAFFAFFSVL